MRTRCEHPLQFKLIPKWTDTTGVCASCDYRRQTLPDTSRIRASCDCKIHAYERVRRLRKPVFADNPIPVSPFVVATILLFLAILILFTNINLPYFRCGFSRTLFSSF